MAVWFQLITLQCGQIADLSNPIIRDYAARISRFRAMVSLAIAAGVTMTPRYGVDHLSKGAVGIADGDSDVDELALIAFRHLNKHTKARRRR